MKMDIVNDKCWLYWWIIPDRKNVTRGVMYRDIGYLEACKVASLLTISVGWP